MSDTCEHKFEECGEYTKKGWPGTLLLYSCALCGYKNPVPHVTFRDEFFQLKTNEEPIL